MNSVMLVVAMSAGQAPPGGFPATPGYQVPVVRTQGVGGPPMVLPNAVPMAMPMPGQPGGMPPMANGNGAPAANGNGNGNGAAAEAPKEEEAPAEDEGPPVYLLERTLRDTWLGKTMADHNLKLYGWTAMNYSVSTNSNSNAPMYFNDRANAFQMNQNWIHFEKSIDTSKDEFQWGFVTDSIVPGTDARTTVARHLFDKQLVGRAPSFDGAVPPAPIGTAAAYPFDLYQAYAQAYLPGLGKGTTVQVGRFATHCGYEQVQAVLTPFVSKSYLFEYNPFTHTGVYALTKLSDTWTVGYGAVVGADNFIGKTDRFNFIGAIKWTPKDSKLSATFNTVITDPQFNVGLGFARYNVYNGIVTYNVSDNLTYVLDATYSHMYNVPGVAGNADWFGGASYFIYKFTDKLTGTLRGEIFEDSEGVRTGFKGTYNEITAGLAWTPLPGVIVRPSVRYDHNSRTRPFEGSDNQWTGAFELIFRW